ncbi:MAG TPA: hypothetical protein RMF84_09820 [Polyangiaceae bacterium LLY-WYZ-14_1]|nr:hypothetical protein [Polyangiaceae bacterium LLY-WYZ-14_1]
MLLELASVAGSIVHVNPDQVVLIRDGAEPGLVDVVVTTGETVVARGRTAGIASLLDHVVRERARLSQEPRGAGVASVPPPAATPGPASARPTTAPPPPPVAVAARVPVARPASERPPIAVPAVVPVARPASSYPPRAVPAADGGQPPSGSEGAPTRRLTPFQR